MSMLDINTEEELFRKIESDDDWLDSPECQAFEDLLLEDETVLLDDEAILDISKDD